MAKSLRQTRKAMKSAERAYDKMHRKVMRLTKRHSMCGKKLKEAKKKEAALEKACDKAEAAWRKASGQKC